MGLLLISLLIGILASPCLDSRSVWTAIPITIVLLILPSPNGRKWLLYLLCTLVGAADDSMIPAVVPIETNTALRVLGRLTHAPEWRGLGAYLDVELQSIDAQPYRGRARLTEFLEDPEQRKLFDDLDLGSGDRVEIVVKLHRPAVYRDPGVFDYRSYLERQGIYWTGTIRNPRLVTVLNRGWHGSDRAKKWISARIEAPFQQIPDSRNIQGLLAGMVLGRTSGLTAEVERQFQAGGIYHLVVVSGFNLAVVAGAVFGIVRWIPCKRRIRLLIVLTCAVTYATMVEGQTPVLRAMLMVAFLIVSQLLDRGYALTNTITASAFIILLIDPNAFEDPSFQMTFAAVLALVGLAAPTSRWFFGWLIRALDDFDNSDKDSDLPVEIADWRISRRVWCGRHGLPTWLIRGCWKMILIAGESLLISVCVESVFIIFMVESFHRLSPISPFINVPAGMAAALVTPLGLLMILLPPPISTLVAWLIKAILQTLLKFVDLALRIPYATLRVPSPPVWVWVLYGVAVVILVLAVAKRVRPACLAGFAAIVALQLVIAFKDVSPAPPKTVTLTFLDVGQGDSALVEFPSGYRMLIDGGGVASGRFLDLRDESTFSIGENVVSPYLFSRGIRALDAVVLTHAHHDHMDGLFSVIENFKVGEFWLGRNPMVPQYRELIARIQKRQIPIRWVSAGETIGPFTVLHPPANWVPKRNDQNNDSVVLWLRDGAATALLTGDIERTIPVPGRVDVLKVPHHGSKGVHIRPEAVVRVISVGANNPFGHPHPSALPALRTDQLGAITVALPVAGWDGRAHGFRITTATLTERRCLCKLVLLRQSHYSQRP